jgi:hypothetical protein
MFPKDLTGEGIYLTQVGPFIMVGSVSRGEVPHLRLVQRRSHSYGDEESIERRIERLGTGLILLRMRLPGRRLRYSWSDGESV